MTTTPTFYLPLERRVAMVENYLLSRDGEFVHGDHILYDLRLTKYQYRPAWQHIVRHRTGHGVVAVMLSNGFYGASYSMSRRPEEGWAYLTWQAKHELSRLVSSRGSLVAMERLVLTDAMFAGQVGAIYAARRANDQQVDATLTLLRQSWRNTGASEETIEAWIDRLLGANAVSSS